MFKLETIEFNNNRACANCRSDLQIPSDDKNAPDLTTCSGLTNFNDLKTAGVVSNFEALSTLFGTEFKLLDLSRSSNSISSHDPIIYLCSNCTCVLANVYHAFVEFAELMDGASTLQKLITMTRNWIEEKHCLGFNHSISHPVPNIVKREPPEEMIEGHLHQSLIEDPPMNFKHAPLDDYESPFSDLFDFGENFDDDENTESLSRNRIGLSVGENLKELRVCISPLDLNEHQAATSSRTDKSGRSVRKTLPLKNTRLKVAKTRKTVTPRTKTRLPKPQRETSESQIPQSAEHGTKRSGAPTDDIGVLGMIFGTPPAKTFPQVNEELGKWLEVGKQSGISFTTRIIRAEARKIAKALGEHEFKASNGWLRAVKSRHQIGISQSQNSRSKKLPEGILDNPLHDSEAQASSPSRTSTLMNKQLERRKKLQSLQKKKSREAAKPLTCTICAKEFKLRDYLRCHMRTHMVKREFKCSHCPSTFTERKRLKCHMNVKHGVGERLPNRTCEICGEYFDLPFRLKDHIARIHNTERPFACKLCGKSFPTAHYLNLHSNNSHKDKDIKACMCELCGKVLAGKESLKYHLGTVHSKEKKYFCPQCPKSSHRPDWLTEHLRTHARRERTLKCKYCDATFFDISILKSHEKRHVTGFDIICSDCGTTFKNKNSLNRHIASRHTEGQSFPCELCGKVFKIKEYLIQHMRSKTHGGLGHYAQRLSDGTTTKVIGKIQPVSINSDANNASSSSLAS